MLTELFYTVNFSVCIIAALIGLPPAILTTTIIYIHRPCHNIPNLLRCNTLVGMILFMILMLISAVHGLREDWARSQFACSLRGYCYSVTCMIICSSYSIQAISRFFYAVLYQFKSLHTWRVHWILIITSWILSIVGQSVPLIFDRDFYTLELESRLCLGTTKRPLASTYALLLAFIMPVGSIMVIYAVIIYRVRRSGLRVQAFVANRRNPVTMNIIPSLNVKRELRLARNMMMLLGLTMCSGLLYSILLIWHLGQWSRPPEFLYLLSTNSTTCGVSAMMILFFFITKEVKTFVIDRLKQLR
jgi:hypothetical protein